MQDAVDFIHGFYESIKKRDAHAISAHYKNSEQTYVILEGPRLATQGYDNIRDGWIAFCISDIRLLSIQWNDGPHVFNFAGSSTLAGVIELQVSIGSKSFTNIFRASFTLEKSKSKYYIVHEHVSGALSDPYGIGDWKK
ncbi:MAG TPA: hypothetical protein PKC30_17025 [Saprospiraceae bacterium]|nr:hypothetical protein [Saprospiraceae bacterium]